MNVNDHVLTAVFSDGRVRRLRVAAANFQALAEAALIVDENTEGTSPTPVDYLSYDPGRPGYLPLMPWPGCRLWFAISEFLFFDEPRRSLSETSGALYVARSRDKRKGLLLQVMPPKSITSRHEHWLKTERFIGLAGSCTLGMADGEVPISSGMVSVITPRTPHYIRTEDGHALNLLIITGHPNPELNLSMEDHHYLPLPEHLTGLRTSA